MKRALTLTTFAGLVALSTAAALRAADPKPAADKPAAPAADAAGDLVKPTADVKSWRLEQHEEAKATITVDAGAIAFDVTNSDGTDWHAQAFQTPLDLKADTEYAVTFSAKAADERPVKVSAGIDEEDWHNIGLDEEITLGKEWKAYEYKFTATDVRANKNRLGFVFGQAKGKLWVKDLVVKPSAKK